MKTQSLVNSKSSYEILPEIMETRQSNVLYVKHLPCSLTSTEKKELLEYFGAVEVRVMPDRGKFVSRHKPNYIAASDNSQTIYLLQKHSAFATFKDTEKAKEAISRLHQIEILNSVISVEFAHSSLKKLRELVEDKSERGEEPLSKSQKDANKKADVETLGKKSNGDAYLLTYCANGKFSDLCT